MTICFTVGYHHLSDWNGAVSYRSNKRQWLINIFCHVVIPTISHEILPLLRVHLYLSWEEDKKKKNPRDYPLQNFWQFWTSLKECTLLSSLHSPAEGKVQYILSFNTCRKCPKRTEPNKTKRKIDCWKLWKKHHSKSRRQDMGASYRCNERKSMCSK